MSNGDLSLEVQEALWQRLAGDSVLVGLIGGANIFDHVPDDQELGPDEDGERKFIQIGDMSGVDHGDKSDPGQESIFDIHCWSRAKTNVPATMMARRVVYLLHERPLQLSAGEAVLIRCQFASMIRDPDGKSRQAVRRFRIITSDPPQPVDNP